MRFVLGFALAFSLQAHANDPAHTPDGVQSKGAPAVAAAPATPAKVEKKKNEKPVDPANPPIVAGTEITVNDYHRDTDIFMVTMTAAPDVGPNFATAADLHKALDREGTVKDFVKNKDQLIGSIFTLSKDLPLIDGEDVVKKYKKVLAARKKQK